MISMCWHMVLWITCNVSIIVTLVAGTFRVSLVCHMVRLFTIGICFKVTFVTIFILSLLQEVLWHLCVDIRCFGLSAVFASLLHLLQGLSWFVTWSVCLPSVFVSQLHLLQFSFCPCFVFSMFCHMVHSITCSVFIVVTLVAVTFILKNHQIFLLFTMLEIAIFKAMFPIF